MYEKNYGDRLHEFIFGIYGNFAGEPWRRKMAMLEP